MNIEEPVPPKLPNSLIIIFSVILTVFVALFLASSDVLQTRLPFLASPSAIAANGTQETIVSPAITSTPTPTITPVETNGADITPTATEVSIIAQATCNNAPTEWVPIVVGPNDTVYSLSIRYGATVGEIVQANCLETGTIFAGMIIYVPASPPPREPCGPPQWWISYIVQPGETLGLLARRHGTTVYAIMQANCLTNTKIFAGRRLFLPPIPATPPPLPTIIQPSRTPTPSPTVTDLPSPTASTTPDGTASPTATGTIPSGTAVPTNTPTPTITGTPPATNSPTPTVSITPVTTPSPTTEVSPTAVPTTTPTLPPTNTPAPTQPATNTPQPTQPPTNTPQPTATTPPEPSNIPQL